MNMSNPSFSTYGKAFQEDLCHLILEDRPFADQMFEVLDEDYLELKYLRVFIQKIREYREKYKLHPNHSAMVTMIKSGLGEQNEAIKTQVVDYSARILSKQEVDNSAFIKDTALDFCRKQKLKEAMVKSVALINNSSFDEISKLINDAIKLGSYNEYGYDYVKDFEKRFERKARNAISTGWPEIDAICANGLGSGELGVVIAPTGAGKSMVLVHLGAQALKAGLNVVHYTLELSDTVIAQRYDSCLTKVPLSDLFQYKDLIQETVRDMKGTLIIKEYPTKSASANTLLSHLEKLRAAEIKVDMVIVDYGDLLKPISSNHREKRNELESIYEELRSIAQQFKCPVWTASQTNRSGLNAEVITMESISEAFSKCFVADLIFSVSRTVEDKQTDSGRIFIAKNRFGPDGVVFPITMRTKDIFIDVKPQGTEDAVAELLNSKDQAAKLKEKYKKFRKDKKEKENESSN